jgi:hypothetical protein
MGGYVSTRHLLVRMVRWHTDAATMNAYCLWIRFPKRCLNWYAQTLLNLCGCMSLYRFPLTLIESLSTLAVCALWLLQSCLLAYLSTYSRLE